MPDLASVIVRTMPGREAMLDEALFSLFLQEHRPLEVVVIGHSRPGDIRDATDRVCSRWKADLNLRWAWHEGTRDMRARSLNLGLKSATGRYVGFLDDDDLVYPAHYRLLVDALEQTGCSWAYAQTMRSTWRLHGGVLQAVGRSVFPAPPAYSFIAHLRDNFIPIHSFLLDRDRIASLPVFDESLSILEDYEFLLNLAVKHQPVRVPRVTCEYRIRLDGSNTAVDGTVGAAMTRKAEQWNIARTVLAKRKQAIVGWWLPELLEGQLPAPESVTNSAGHAQAAQKIVDDYWYSTSWRVTALLRAMAGAWRRRPREERPLVKTVEEAQRVVSEIRKTTSWRVTAPLRAIGDRLRAR